MEKSLRSSAVNYGIYIGIVLVTFTVIAYAIDLGLLTKWWLGLILFFIIVIIGIISVAKAKKILEGFISFKQAFTSWFITIVIGIIISTLVNIVLFNFIDPGAAEIVKEATIEVSVAMMENFGAPQSEIDKAVSTMQEQNQFAIGTLLKSLAWQFLFYAVIGLIVAVVMKKKNPDVA